MGDGPRPSYSHGQGKLANPTFPNPQEHASAKSGQGMSAGKGSGSQDLGSGKSFSDGEINHVPAGKGPGTSRGMSPSTKAKGLDKPFGQ